MAQVIAEIYEIQEKIGAGGGGIVYLGRHLRLDKQVVLKADKRTLKTGTDTLRREVDMLKDLSHTYIPQVYDFVQEGGVVYTVMDYIEGESLDRLLGRKQIPSQPQIIRWACQLLEALSYLHGRPPHGILHGDIKPANIMLRPDGNVCLIDFNIALALGEDGAVKVGFSRGYASPEHYGADYISSNVPAAVGRAFGTVDSVSGSMNPARAGRKGSGYGKDAAQDGDRTETDDDTEATQLEEDTDRTELDRESGSFRSQGSRSLSGQSATGKKGGIMLDVRSDIYSLGATLYHLLSGRRPAQDAREVEPLAPENCSPEVSAIIQKAMSPDPAMRYQTAEEMRMAFRQLPIRDMAARRHRKRIMASTIILSMTFLAGGVTAFIGLKQLEQRQAALALAEYSANSLAQGDVSAAVDQALQAIPRGKSILEAPATARAQKALTDALGVYDLTDGFKSADTIGLPSAPFDMAVSPKGTMLAVVYGYEAAIYDLGSRDQLAVLPVQNSAMADCLFTDEEHVVYAGQDGVALYDLSAGGDVWTGEAATTLAVSGDGKVVAAVDRAADRAFLYSVADGTKIGECFFQGAHMTVADNDIFADPKKDIFSLNGDGSLLAVSFSAGGLMVFDLRDSDGDMILYDESGYAQFQGGFCGKYFAFAANGAMSQFGLVDTEEKTFAGGLESRDGFLLKASEDGIWLGSGNTLTELNLDTMEETETAYTGSVDMTNFAVDGQHALVATEDNGFSFYNNAASLMSSESGNQNADFLALAGPYAVIGNRTETALRVMELESHEDAELARYDARDAHEEARLSADGKTVMLFGYQGFRIYDISGELLVQEKLEDADTIYDQQFRREGETSWLEVIWYDGIRRNYSASDGSLLSEEAGEAPAKDLYEEFFVGDYRIASGLHDAPVVYDAKSGREVAVLETDGYLAYVTQMGDYFITEYIDADGRRYGLLLNERFEPLAYLPGLCDTMGDVFVFDDGAGSLRQSRLYSLEELVALGEELVREMGKDESGAALTGMKGRAYLWTIAGKCYGNSRLWEKIYRVNRELILVPRRICADQRIVIPAEE